MADKQKKNYSSVENMYRKIALAFLGVVIALIIATIFYSASKATIEVVVNDSDVQTEFAIAVKDVPVRNGFVARKLEVAREIEGEFVSSFVDTGEPAKARGTVILKNESSVAQPLIATTRVLHESDILFRLEEAVTVPANGEVEAVVVADKEGKDGEVAPGKFTIPGLATSRQSEVYAMSITAFSGGTKLEYQLSDDDIEAAQETLLDQARKELGDDLDVLLQDNEIMLEGAVFAEIANSEVSAEVGDAVEKFDVKLEVNLIAYAVNEDDLWAFIEKRFADELGEGLGLEYFDKDESSYEVASFDEENQIVTLDVDAVGYAGAEAGADIFDKDALMGLTPEEVKTQLMATGTVESVEVQLWPLWVRTVPSNESRIFIKIR